MRNFWNALVTYEKFCFIKSNYQEKFVAESDHQTALIHVNIELTGKTLETIVQTAKQRVGQNSKGHYRVDTADVVSHMISRFLLEKNFESFAQNPDNYPF
jgi:hypothetical protein